MMKNSILIHSVADVVNRKPLLTQSVEVIEIDQQRMVFEIPLTVLSKNQTLLVECDLFINDEKIQFQFTANIENIVNDLKRLRLIVHLSQYETRVWKSFVENVQSLQLKVDKILKDIKGE